MRKTDNTTVSIGIGLPVLMMIFTVLCMTVFACITCLQATYNEKESRKWKLLGNIMKRSFRQVRYMKKIVENPENLELLQENDIEHDGDIYRYSVKINETKRLQVTLELAEELKILQWQQISQAVISRQSLPASDGGRVPAYEVMKSTPAIRTQIRDNKLHLIENTMLANKDTGMITMDDALLQLYKENLIDKDTALQYAVHPDMVLPSVAVKRLALAMGI